MKTLSTTLILCVLWGAFLACAPRSEGDQKTTADPDLAAFIGKIRAVDNHSHVNSVAPNDTDSDALPLDSLMPIELPATARPDNPDWLAAYKALYGYPHADLSEAHLKDLHAAMQSVAREQGDRFPAWVLDQIGTEVILTNRIAMGPGLQAPRFLWVSYADALLLPLSNKAEAATTPDREKLYPLEEKLLQRYLSDLKASRLPSSLDAYLKAVVTPVLEAQRKGGCVAIKFEAAYLRSLDFDQVRVEDASRVYAKYVGGGEPSHGDYKALQDFLFRYLARESGRLGMAVHVHSFEGVGNYYNAAGADPLLMESVFNDPSLRKTNFVIIHGGGVNARHAEEMAWKPNVYLDMSLMTMLYTPARLAAILRSWLTQFPERVLFGTDAAALGPDMGWEIAASVATSNARKALAVALTEMIRSGEVSRTRAEELATMVMRTNGARLYKLGLK